jgi:hypothetical protein
MLSYALAAFVAANWISTPFIPCIIVAGALVVVLMTPGKGRLFLYGQSRA